MGKAKASASASANAKAKAKANANAKARARATADPSLRLPQRAQNARRGPKRATFRMTLQREEEDCGGLAAVDDTSVIGVGIWRRGRSS